MASTPARRVPVAAIGHPGSLRPGHDMSEVACEHLLAARAQVPSALATTPAHQAHDPHVPGVLLPRLAGEQARVERSLVTTAAVGAGHAAILPSPSSPTPARPVFVRPEGGAA